MFYKEDETKQGLESLQEVFSKGERGEWLSSQRQQDIQRLRCMKRFGKQRKRGEQMGMVQQKGLCLSSFCVTISKYLSLVFQKENMFIWPTILETESSLQHGHISWRGPTRLPQNMMEKQKENQLQAEMICGPAKEQRGPRPTCLCQLAPSETNPLLPDLTHAQRRVNPFMGWSPSDLVSFNWAPPLKALSPQHPTLRTKHLVREPLSANHPHSSLSRASAPEK